MRGETARREPARGQVIVIFALSLVALMAVAGLAFDIGRFYSEKRFLQNAADAGALAVANALIRGESATDAEAEGRDVLARNLAGSPTGTPAQVAMIPQYATGHPGIPAYLISGVLIESGGDVRVAIESDVTYTFGRVIGLGSAVVSGQARVATKGDLLPIAVRHYVNAPGLAAWFVGMRLLRMTPHDGPTVRLWDRIVVPAARAVESRVRPPFGQSVFAVGRVPDVPSPTRPREG